MELCSTRTSRSPFPGRSGFDHLQDFLPKSFMQMKHTCRHLVSAPRRRPFIRGTLQLHLSDPLIPRITLPIFPPEIPGLRFLLRFCIILHSFENEIICFSISSLNSFPSHISARGRTAEVAIKNIGIPPLTKTHQCCARLGCAARKTGISAHTLTPIARRSLRSTRREPVPQV